MKTKTDKLWLAFVVAILCMAIGTGMNMATQTNLGKVKVQRVRYSDLYGNMVSAMLYIPKTATTQTPAPAVMTNHGGGGSNEAQSSYNTELARRGFVVLSWDASNCGSSERSVDKSHGAQATYNFLQSLDYVQKDQLAASGHSMGGVYTFDIAQAYPKNIRLIVAVGMNPAMNNLDIPLETNYVAIIGAHDESALVRNKGDIMNLVRSDDYRKLFALPEGELVEPDTLYGDFAKGTARAFYMPNSTHAGAMIDKKVQNIYLEIVQTALTAPRYIEPENQVWYWKDIGMALQFIGLITLMFALATALIRAKAFETLVLPVRQPVGYQNKSLPWYIAFGVLLLLPTILFIPTATIAQKVDITKVFGLDNTANGFVFWSVISGIALFVLFLVFHYTYGKKKGGNLMTYGLATHATENKVDLRYVTRAVCFALIVMGGSYLAYLIMYGITGGDIHLWLASIRPVGMTRIAYFPIYLLALLPFFIACSLATRSIGINNGARANGDGMRNSVLCSGIMGIAGLACLFAVFFAVAISTGTVLFPANRGYIYAGAVFSMLPAFAVGNALNCYITNKTNSIYAGTCSAMLWSAWLLVATNAIA